MKFFYYRNGYSLLLIQFGFFQQKLDCSYYPSNSNQRVGFIEKLLGDDNKLCLGHFYEEKDPQTTLQFTTSQISIFSERTYIPSGTPYFNIENVPPNSKFVDESLERINKNKRCIYIEKPWRNNVTFIPTQKNPIVVEIPRNET